MSSASAVWSSIEAVSGTSSCTDALALRTAVFELLGGAAMNRNDRYLSHAADCQLMACRTRDEHERQKWLDMAQTWLRLVEPPKCISTSRSTNTRRYRRADRNHFGNAA